MGLGFSPRLGPAQGRKPRWNARLLRGLTMYKVSFSLLLGLSYRNAALFKPCIWAQFLFPRSGPRWHIQAEFRKER